MKRAQILEKAKHTILYDRTDVYGNPENSFADIAHLWNWYLELNEKIRPDDVAVMMILLKVARAKYCEKLDNYVDIAGYAALAGELMSKPDNLAAEIDAVMREDVKTAMYDKMRAAHECCGGGHCGD